MGRDDRRQTCVLVSLARHKFHTCTRRAQHPYFRKKCFLSVACLYLFSTFCIKCFYLFSLTVLCVVCAQPSCVCVCLCERTFGKQAKQGSPGTALGSVLLSSVSDSCLSAFSKNPSIRVLKTGPSSPAWIFLRGLWRTLPWRTNSQRFSWIHFCWLVEVTQCLYAASLLTPCCLAYCSVMSGLCEGVIF